MHPSENFNVGHNFCNIEDSNLIFSMHVYLMKLKGQGHPSRSVIFLYKNCLMHVYLMELHILSGERSRSSFKVKCELVLFYFFQSGAVGDIVFLTNTSLVCTYITLPWIFTITVLFNGIITTYLSD